MSNPDSSLPATTEPSTGDPFAKPEKEFFTEQQLALFEKLIEVCRGAVRATMIGPDQASEHDRYGYGILMKAGVIDDEMDKKTKRRVIGAFWSTIDHIRERRGIDKELVDYVSPIFQVLFTMKVLP